MKNLLFYTIVVCSMGCHTASNEKDRIILDFDSISNTLERTNTLLYPSNAEYDSLIDKAWHHYEIQQLHYTINDFPGYLSSFRSRFEQFITDSMNNVEANGNEIGLTRAFLKTDNTAGILYLQLQAVISALRPHARDSALIEKIDQLEANTTGRFNSPEKFVKAYFYDTPPKVVITILNSFEQQVKDLTVYVLREYFKTH